MRLQANPIALTRATVYSSPADDPIHDGTVLIRDGKIAAVQSGPIVLPENAEILDCDGCTLIAGLWNCHVHFFERKWTDAAAIPALELKKQLQEMLTRFGFTSVFDTGSIWENTRAIRDRIESGEVAGPRIRSTGEPLVAAGALPPEVVIRIMGFMNMSVPEISSASQSAAAAARLLDQGVDAIKVHLQPPPPPQPRFPDESIRAAVAEAHARGKPVFVHPNDGADVLRSIEAGVNVIAHTTPHSGPWDDAILQAASRYKPALIPTLWIWKYYARHDRISAQDQIIKTELDQLRGWLSTGERVLFGTDLGAVDPDPAEEYFLMNEAGMDFRQILTSLTTSPAEQFGVSSRSGRIAKGYDADFAVLNGDPSTDLRALSDVQYTLCRGRVVYSKSTRVTLLREH